MKKRSVASPGLNSTRMKMSVMTPNRSGTARSNLRRM